MIKPYYAIDFVPVLELNQGSFISKFSQLLLIMGEKDRNFKFMSIKTMIEHFIESGYMTLNNSFSND